MSKKVTYTSTNTYDTMHSYSPETKNVWIVLHGIGYLSRYFIRLFQELDATENYIIAPQAPSKYYKDYDYKKVGASWLTRENTVLDTKNVLQYLDAVVANEHIQDMTKVTILGYSQGVSIAARWVASRKIKPGRLIFVSGAFPKELNTNDFMFLDDQTKIHHIVGDNDPYFEKKNVAIEQIRVKKILPTIAITTHPGGHELDIKSLKSVL